MLTLAGWPDVPAIHTWDGYADICLNIQYFLTSACNELCALTLPVTGLIVGTVRSEACIVWVACLGSDMIKVVIL